MNIEGIIRPTFETFKNNVGFSFDTICTIPGLWGNLVYPFWFGTPNLTPASWRRTQMERGKTRR